MAWEQLAIDRPHLVYIILGGFTSLFMLCSSVIKERLYIGEATVATICGIIFGPHAANLINPLEWGNTDQITLEFSRIVLVVQCFAVGVELPKYYMEKHWRSVTLLLVPVMTFGWLMTSLFIWLTMHDRLNWLDSLVCAACVTATDPVLASSVVGKGKFAKRVPKHLRDLLSAESGCNDGMAFPFVYLGLYLIRYRPDAGKVAEHWICTSILYECVFGAVYGVIVGYLARKGIRYAHERELIDRESFLVFYFVLALFCAGSGSILGLDDLLVGFACGVGFSNDGWFTEKTEESHVSNVIDLLINLTFFVYLGTIIPWEQYNQPELLGTSPWRLVVIALLVIFFRRIPIMMMLKPIIPDIKTWREALFAGHFGPIGVGAIFVAILARAEIETEGTTPLAVLPPHDFPHANIIELIWPITTFLVITSILVHGSSIAVFTLGKHINTLTITMSYTHGADENYNWMDRLPRIQSRSKSQMSKLDASESSLEEKLPEYPSSVSLGDRLPRNFLRRQREDDPPSRSQSRSGRRRKTLSWDSGVGPGGPVSRSAIAPTRRQEPPPSLSPEKSESDTLAPDQTSSSNSPSATGQESSQDRETLEQQEEVYKEGDDRVIEDEDGNVLEVLDSRKKTLEEGEQEAFEKAKDLLSPTTERRISEVPVEENTLEKLESNAEVEMQEIKEMAKNAKAQGWRDVKQLFGKWAPRRGQEGDEEARPAGMVGPSDRPSSSRRGPARAFRFGRTIIVEDEDGEVIKKYDIPPNKPKEGQENEDLERARQGLQKMGSYLGFGPKVQNDDEGGPSRPQPDRRGSKHPAGEDDDDPNIRFTLGGDSRRMSKAEFIQQIQNLNPKARGEALDESSAPDTVKREAKANVQEDYFSRRPSQADRRRSSTRPFDSRPTPFRGESNLERLDSRQEGGADGTEPPPDIPTHSFARDLKKLSIAGNETPAERRRRLATTVEEDSDDDGTVRVPPSRRRADSQRLTRGVSPHSTPGQERSRPSLMTNPTTSNPSRAEEETPAEKRRREAALGKSTEPDSDEDESQPRRPPQGSIPEEPSSPSQSGPSRGIRFAEQPSMSTQSRLGGKARKFGKKFQ